MDHSTGASLGKVSFLVLWHIWTNLAANIAVNRWNVDHLLCCVRPRSARWPQMRLCSRITWSSKLFHCNSYLLSVPINFAISCDTTFPLCSRFYGIPLKFTFSLAARSSEERRLAARGLVSVKRDSTCFVRLTWVKDSGLGLELNEMSVTRILLIWSMKKMLLICENQYSISIL